MQRTMITAAGIALIAIASFPARASAQEESPKPPEAAKPSAAEAQPKEPGEMDTAEEERNESDEAEGDRLGKPTVRNTPETADELLARYTKAREGAEHEILSGQGTIHIYQLIEEMVDELVADVAQLRMNVVSPTALRAIELSDNLSPQLGLLLETTAASTLGNSTPMLVKHCVACRAARSRVEGQSWIVTEGIVDQDALVREAERLSVRTFLDLSFAYFPGQNMVVLQARFVRPDDGAILWAETYRSDATTAAILRTGDRVLTRNERVAELERKLEARPYWGYKIYGGAAYIPYDSPLGGISGGSLGLRLYEKFGEDRRWLYGIGAEVFANLSEDNPLLGAFIGATLLYDVLSPNLNWARLRTGPTVNGFFAGNQGGNSWAIEWNVEVIFQFRLGLGVSAMYFKPTEFDGADLGGFGAKGRMSFDW